MPTCDTIAQHKGLPNAAGATHLLDPDHGIHHFLQEQEHGGDAQHGSCEHPDAEPLPQQGMPVPPQPMEQPAGGNVMRLTSPSMVLKKSGAEHSACLPVERPALD